MTVEELKLVIQYIREYPRGHGEDLVYHRGIKGMPDVIRLPYEELCQYG